MCNAGDPSLIPGLGRSTGEGKGYTLQYSWVSLVAQLVKNLPAMWETWVRSLVWEDPLEKAKATHSSILAWRIPWTVQSMGLQSQISVNTYLEGSLHCLILIWLFQLSCSQCFHGSFHLLTSTLFVHFCMWYSQYLIFKKKSNLMNIIF